MNNAFEGVKKVHLMGIGGAGVSALALLLDGMGFEVSGCDLAETSYCKKLHNIPIRIGHDISHVSEFSPDLVVYTSAIPKNNLELLSAKSNPKIKTISRGDALSWIFNEKFGVGIAGAHGKTTTTSMIGLVLDRAGLAPSIAVGGEVLDVGTNAKIGASDIMVAELDESDGSFEKFFPAVTVITNIDWDHVDHFKSVEEVEEAFERFAKSRKNGSPLVICASDSGAVKLINRLQENNDDKVVLYGFDSGCEWSANDIEPINGGGMSYSLFRRGEILTRVKLKVPGLHNVLNSLAACAVSDMLGVPLESFVDTIGAFSGAKRRFQFVGQIGKLKIYDDYAHHPVEIRATLEATKKAFPGEKITVVFEPHRYTRTLKLYKEFANALSLADNVFLLPIYSADEPPIDGVSSSLIANCVNDGIIHQISVPFRVCSEKEELYSLLDKSIHDGLLLTIGAGSITEVGYDYLKRKNILC